MSQRARSKGLQSTEKILGAGLPVKEYAIGVIGPDPRGTVAILILAFAAVVAVTVLFFGLIVIPGFLLLGAIFGAIDRPASFAVTERGLVVLARSEVNGRPRKLLTVLPQSVLASPTVKRSGGYVHLPDLHVWMRRKDHERLVGVAGNNAAASQWAAPVPAGVGPRSAPGPSAARPSSVASPAPAPAPPGPGAVATLQPDREADVLYCSWCGKERAVNAQAIHYCGSMERPAAFCMRCGTALHEGAAACGSCGTPATQLSR
jgi:hypothetical protein